MKRDEAKQEWAKVHPLDLDLDSVIDVIYDDFENRSCESCKFGMTYHFDDEIECFKIEADTQGIYFSKDFCCNKWESIDEK